ncbi:hypothetical protein AXG93_2839s1340 [Marchantia polymorpha subsp. ruderalis]|uniref:Uncharacterized protein n=1 Tax=Marchantia polymorpha subsp. ruderalis TaxID=1480154 RepID=A0A176VDN0_MARPO|nr:hypothetical protein AXG93_2839s1340 [Marchantia polymorpha subsp. ruderalis]
MTESSESSVSRVVEAVGPSGPRQAADGPWKVFGEEGRKEAPGRGGNGWSWGNECCRFRSQLVGGCPLITAHGDPGRAPCPALYKWKVGISTLEMPSSLSKSRTLIALSPSPSPSTLDPRRLLFPLVDYPRALQMVRPTFPCPTIPAAQQAGPVVLAQGPRIWLASASLFPTPSSPPFRDIHILNANNHTLVSQEDRGDVNED